MSIALLLETCEIERITASKECEIALAECAYLEAMVDSKLAINLAKSELKCMQESTAESYVSDLAYLFNEAEKEAEEKNEGILSKFVGAIKKFFINTWNSIQKLFTKENTEAWKKLHAEELVAEDTGNLLDQIEAAVNEAKGIDFKRFGKVGLIATLIGGGGAAAYANWDKIKEAIKPSKMNGKKVEDNAQKIARIAKAAAEEVERLEDGDLLMRLQNGTADSEEKEGVEKAKGFWNKVRELITFCEGKTNAVASKIQAKTSTKRMAKAAPRSGELGDTNNPQKPATNQQATANTSTPGQNHDTDMFADSAMY